MLNYFIIHLYSISVSPFTILMCETNILVLLLLLLILLLKYNKTTFSYTTVYGGSFFKYVQYRMQYVALSAVHKVS